MDRPETKRGAGAAASLFLPDDAVEEILSRVPTKSLCRFKCVSQGWHGLISDLLRRGRTWFILERTVHFAEKPGEGRLPGWKVLDCRSRMEYGWTCGSSVLKDLLLLAHVVDPPGVSSLCIQASICADRRPDAIHGRVVATEKNLAVIWACFNELSCYLIYNSDDLSLTMIPDPFPMKPSWGWWARKMGPPLLLQPEGSGYPVLVFLMKPLPPRHPPLRRHPLPEGIEHLPAAQSRGVWRVQDVSKGLYSVLQYRLRPPPLPLNSSSVLHPVCKKAMFKGYAVPSYIQIHDVFTWEDKCFWADLLQGVLSCDLSDLFDADDIDQVSFSFIHLPQEVDINCTTNCKTNPLCFPKMYRTMACVGGSIKLLCIEMHYEDLKEFLPPEPENRRVTVWTLGRETMGWEKESELRMKDLWKHQDFKSAHLPESLWAPRWPILCPEAGVFYMMIGDFYGDDESDEEDGGGPHNICITMLNDKLSSVSSSCLPPTMVCSGLKDQFGLVHSRLFQGSKGLHSPLAVRKGEQGRVLGLQRGIVVCGIWIVKAQMMHCALFWLQGWERRNLL